MKILNYGSMNIDHVYQVDAIVKPGQTISSHKVNIFPGGKGLNQSIALARAGAEVYHASLRGEDGKFLQDLLEESGADCRFLKTVDGMTGTAFIQVDANGQNCIVLDAGTNNMNTREYCDEVLAFFAAGDMILLQNEINEVPYLIDKAYEKGMFIVLNPSPMNEKVLECDLQKVSMFLMNEDEGADIAGTDDESKILEIMAEKYPSAEVVMTLGSRGSVYQGNGKQIRQTAVHVKAVDTTAAGDTYTGYLLASMAAGCSMAESLQRATKASAIAVTRPGAASSIPYLREIQ